MLERSGLLDADVQAEGCICNLLEVSIRAVWLMIEARLPLTLSEQYFHN
jgi:hypothetical protein